VISDHFHKYRSYAGNKGKWVKLGSKKKQLYDTGAIHELLTECSPTGSSCVKAEVLEVSR